jgi:purine-nucleoside phosphorylase
MSIHIGAQPGEIADTVLLPGDPLRAEFVARTYLSDAICYNRVRGMLGFTGTYTGRRVSVQGTGIGVPSAAIYVQELIAEYGVKQLIRIGTCGAMRSELDIGDVILAQAASTDSAVNRSRFDGADFAATASYALLRRADDLSRAKGIRAHVGSVLTSDTFFNDDPGYWKLWAGYGVLAVEMETVALYTLAAKLGVQALSILTVSDNLVTGRAARAEDRQQAFTAMMELALALCLDPA